MSAHKRRSSSIEELFHSDLETNKILSSFKADFEEVNVVNFYNEVKWYFPKMKNNQLISTPLTNGKQPDCAFFVKDISRQCESIEYTQLL